MSTLPAVRLIVNPQAGNGKGLVLAKRLEATLRASGCATGTHIVGSSVETRAWVERCPDDFGYLLCVGGDNTLSEIAPLALQRRIPLVPVPVGFGNVFARNFGHRARIPSLLRLLEHGEVRWVDVGVDLGGVFLSSRSFGFLEDAKRAVEDQVTLPRSQLLRSLAYVRTALGIIKTQPLPSVRVEVDDELLTDQATVAIVANVPTYRGFVTFTPRATPFDELLDVFVVPPVTKRALVSLLLAFLFRLPGRWRGVLRAQGKRVAVGGPGEEPEELSVLPHALPVLTPAAPPSARL